MHSLSIYKTAIEDIHKQEEEKAKELETFTQMKKEHEQENLEVLEYDTNNSSECVDTRELWRNIKKKIVNINYPRCLE